MNDGDVIDLTNDDDAITTLPLPRVERHDMASVCDYDNSRRPEKIPAFFGFFPEEHESLRCRSSVTNSSRNNAFPVPEIIDISNDELNFHNSARGNVNMKREIKEEVTSTDVVLDSFVKVKEEICSIQKVSRNFFYCYKLIIN